jgi:hypothetical protein
MTNAQAAGTRPHGAIRAAVAAATLTVAACFGAAISFAQTPAEPAATQASETR